MTNFDSASICKEAQVCPATTVGNLFRAMLLGLLAIATPHLSGQATARIVTPTAPTYVDSVTGLVTITGQPTATGTVTYSVDGGATATANIVSGNAYLNLGQFPKGNHVLTITEAHPGSAVVPSPPPVPFTVTDQAFSFIGTQGPVLTFADGYSFGVQAVLCDDQDNLYASDYALNRVQYADRFGKITTLPLTGLANPWGLAFDAAGDLYIADYNNDRVIEYSKAGVQTTLSIPGLGRPTQLASDRTKNLLYIEDPDNNRVLTFDLTTGAPAGEAVSGVTQLIGITVAPGGDLYYSSRTDGFFHRTSSGAVIPLYFNISSTYIGGIYADRKGNLYVTDQGYNVVLRIDSQGHCTRINNGGTPVLALADDSYGRIFLAIGPRVEVISPGFGQLADTVSNGVNASNNSLIYSMPQGQTGLTTTVAPAVNFNLFGGYGCPYTSIWGTCNTYINFAATAPGLRVGNAVSSPSPGGATISTAIYGRSMGSAPAFSPGTQTSSSAGTTAASGVFLDQSGNYYASDISSNQVFKTPVGGVPTALPFTGLTQPTVVAVDGLKAVYVLDSGNKRIVKLDAAGNQTSLLVAGQDNNLSSITSFALDGSGQIVYAGTTGTVYLYDRNGVSSPFASGLGTSVALALDEFADLYTLQQDGSVVRIDVYGNQTTLAQPGTFVSPIGLAVDASQTAYVVESGTGAVTLLHPDGTTLNIPVPELWHAEGISIDGHGSILAIDSVTNQYTFVDRTHQDFNFGDVQVNTTKTFPSYFTNSGTAPFTITGGLPGDSDFKQVATPDACDSSAATTVVAAAASCNLSYTVSPTTDFPITAYFRITTDASLDFDTFSENVVASSPLTLTPTLDFGSIQIGSTSTKYLSLTNNGTSAVALTGASLTGTGFQDQSGTCGSSIAAGATCTLGISFTPSLIGGIVGTYTLTDSAGTQAATLTGNGVATPTVTLTPATFNFGNVTTGTFSSEQLFTLTSTSSAPLGLKNYTISGPGFGTPPFEVTDPCPESQPNVCVFVIDFAPKVAGPATGTLTITDAAGTQTVALSGTGVAPTATLTPATYNFGNVTTGTFQGKTFVLIVAGSASAGVKNYTVSGPGFSFPIDAPNPCPISQPGNCVFAVDFAPTVAGPATGILTITDAAGTQTVALSGTGVAPTATLTPTSFNFGNVTTGTFSAEQIFTLTSTSSTPLGLKNYTISGPGFGYPPFEVTNPCPESQPNVCVFVIDFAPKVAGPATGTLTITDAAGTQTVALSGTGIAPTATLTPTTFNFGNVTTGTFSSEQIFTLTSTSSTPLGLKNYTISGPGFGYPPFEVTNPCPESQPNVCVFVIDFAPKVAGPATGTLTITDAAGTQTVALSGTGVAPTATLTPTSFNFGNVTTGTFSAEQIFTLTSTSSTPLGLKNYTISGPGFGYPPFEVTNPCPESQPNVCVFVIDFAPKVAGPATGTLTITDAAGTQTVALSGTGIAPPPLLTLTPGSYAFGSLVEGSGTRTEILTLTNSGGPAANVSLSFAETAQNQLPTFHPDSFSNTTTCGSTLASGASCAITVSFTPQADVSSTYRVQATAYAGATPVTATLTGAGLLDAPNLVISPSFSSVGTLTPGSTATQVITLTNTGTEPANFVAVDGFGYIGSNFALASSSCLSENLLAPGASCNYIVTFTAGASGTSGYSILSVEGYPGTNSVSAEVVGYAGTVAVNPVSIDDGNGFTLDSLTLNGPATVTNKVLQLTSDKASQTSSAFYPTPVPTSRFTSDLSFQLLDPNAEGITFTIQGDGPNAIGSGGGGLGYQGLAKSIALKFDLKNTAGEGIDSTGVYVDGAAPTVPATSLAASGIDLHSGHVFALHLAYDGTTVSTSLTDSVTKAVWSAQVAEDIPGIVGSNTAYVGFTAGSGTPSPTPNAAASERPAISALASPSTSQTTTATSNILSWVYSATPSTGTSQTISFPALAAQTYGAAPVSLAATASSGLPVSYTITGPAKLSGSALTITGAGTVSVTATQEGNATYAAAAPVTQSFAVARAPLTVKANSLSRVSGAANPALTYTIIGFVDSDTTAVVGGSATLATTAVSTSPAGSYPITFATEDLSAANYSFTYFAGTLTITASGSRCSVVDYSKGFTSAGLTLNGSAKITNGLLQLTDGKQFEAASAYFSTPLPTTSFTTNITFQLLNPVADGITLTIQAAGPHALGRGGGSLGYAGIPRSIALKFDLHNNAGEGTNSTGIYYNGAVPTEPSISLNGSGIDLHSGHIFELLVTYDGAKTNLTLTDTLTKAVWNDSVPGSIAEELGTDSAYFGFTAGTGTSSAIQNILSWTYSGGAGCEAN